MIIPKAEKLSASQLQELESIVSEFKCTVLEIEGHNQCVYAILGDETHALMFKRIAGLSYIRKVDAIESPYKLMDRRSALADHQIKIGQRVVGGDAPFIIGGPCTIDPNSPQLYIETAHAFAVLDVRKFSPEEVIVFNCSGRGDKDLDTYIDYFKFPGAFLPRMKIPIRKKSTAVTIPARSFPVHKIREA